MLYLSIRRPALLLLGLLLLVSLVQAGYAQDWEQMQGITPRDYVCYRAATPPRIDGVLDDAAWQAAPWTDYFVDIEGDRKPPPRFRTRARLLWDDDYLYVGAYLEEPHVWGALTKRNAIIFHDSDFEIFIDPDGDNHHYYEFEINALNTIWELTLDKPYKDGGPATHGTNVEGLLSAVHVDGTLNAAHDLDTAWSVEVAIPWAGLTHYSPSPVPPQDGDHWRINFSRVEWRHEMVDGVYRKTPESREDNWVWSPQGIIDMHRPERWGYVQFSTAEPGTAAFRPDPTLPARDLLMKVYHRQKQFYQEHERWAATLDELGLQKGKQSEGDAWILGMKAVEGGFTVTVSTRMPDGSTRLLFTNHASRIWSE